MTIGAADVIAPVFATTKVVALFLARVTSQARLRRVFRRLVLESNYFQGIAFSDMVFAWTMRSFTAGALRLPTADRGKLGMGGVRKRFELIFVTIFAGVAADVT